MKVLLINPPKKNTVWVGIPEIFEKGIYLFPPLSLMYIKTFLQQNLTHKVDILDGVKEDLNYINFERRIKIFQPEVVGITALTHNLIDVVKTAQLVKRINNNIHVCLGGPHVNAYPIQSIHLANIDSIIIGDGETAFAKLVHCLDNAGDLSKTEGMMYKYNGGVINGNPLPVYLTSLDTLPFPSRDIKRDGRYFVPATRTGLMTTMISSRGCPNRCPFCWTHKGYRSRSVKNIVDEIEECIGIGFKEIFFVDDIFNETPQRVIGISEEILKRRLKVIWGFKARINTTTFEMLKKAKQAGCYKIHYGVETGTDEGLNQLKKRITTSQVKETFHLTMKAGIESIAYFMIGCPHEKTREDILKTIDFSIKINADYSVFALFSPYPDTEIYKEGVHQGIINDNPWRKFLVHPDSSDNLTTCWEQYFSKDELLNMLKLAHRKYYLRLGYILRNIFKIHSILDLKRKVIGFISLFKLESYKYAKGKI